MTDQVSTKKQEIVTDSDVSVIILLAENNFFNTTKKYYDMKICGKTSLQWMQNAVGENVNIKKVACTQTADIVSNVKPYLGDKKYTAVLYADTPLLQRKTFLEIMAYVKHKNLSVCKLTRGYVFETEHLKQSEKVYAPQTHYFEEEDFITNYNLKQLSLIEDVMRRRILNYHMKNGVRVIDPASTYVDADVTIAENVVIYPNNNISGECYIEANVTINPNNIIKDSYLLKGSVVTSSVISNSIVGKKSVVGPFADIYQNTVISEDCIVKGNNIIKNSKIEKNVKITTSVLEDCEIGESATIGPNARIRNNARIGENCRIGNFCEVKNSTVGKDTKMSHLSYMGDATVGKDCNIGAGVVFCNYDGKNKNKTLIGDNVFIGSNNSLIAPLEIKTGAFTAAGSTINKPVENGEFAIARAKQENKTREKKD